MARPVFISLQPTYALLAASVLPATLAQYGRGLRTFAHWCLPAAGPNVVSLEFSSIAAVDAKFAAYVDFLFRLRLPLSRAHDAFYALLLFNPVLRGRLNTSAALVRRLSRVRRSVSPPPLTWHLTVLLASTMLTRGRPRLGVGLLLAFDCYLRINEWLSLRREDVLLPGPGRPQHALVVIRKAKTGNGQPQVVRINRPVVVQLLRLVLARTAAGERLFPFSAQWVRAAMADTSERLGLPRFRPHGLRHGGASQDYDDGMDIARIIVRGRWAVERSARRYIHAGVALLFDVHRFEKQAQLGVSLEPHLLRLFAGAAL